MIFTKIGGLIPTYIFTKATVQDWTGWKSMPQNLPSPSNLGLRKTSDDGKKTDSHMRTCLFTIDERKRFILTNSPKSSLLLPESCRRFRRRWRGGQKRVKGKPSDG